MDAEIIDKGQSLTSVSVTERGHQATNELCGSLAMYKSVDVRRRVCVSEMGSRVCVGIICAPEATPPKPSLHALANL